jgi:hypothetical protein
LSEVDDEILIEPPHLAVPALCLLLLLLRLLLLLLLLGGYSGMAYTSLRLSGSHSLTPPVMIKPTGRVRD